ncbi:DUF1553 domain-containing protein [Luteolibacter pohnpeiensis]|uniref:DUF1553 domain-containing protein n=1 Tax=Luteolibacter pohnpeiensis TaxID=454153 RepID=A0A934VTJ1_9BACT|nr:DUF1553 domain-containing protein [Luteolibacter pohnpeiensis]MBK1881542.1 DUF1553 domain-containing protein [Luteolibacter pohnpeiensis]
MMQTKWTISTVLAAAGIMFLVGCGKTEKTAKAAAAEKTTASAPVSFNADIQPILSEYCYHCHGPDSGSREPKDEPLRLDQPEMVFAVRKNGKPVIVKGDPASSLFMHRIQADKASDLMPPPDLHKPLPPEKIALLEQWISEGAVFEKHWAFIPPVRPKTPENQEASWEKNPIDAFVLHRLQQHHLTPAPKEDPRTLIRRASLDLTGLLPDPADVEAFAKNPTDEAYQAYLDRLFASPTYAENRARYWLDYARYSDTHGLHFDNYRSIWPYRDYVIRSFAANKPFDQFVKEQLAGDLLPDSTADSLIATGYIRSNVSTNEGGTIPEEIHVNNTRDRTEAFGATFLGLTVGCAACHDHKFDPTSQKDFYSLGAFFNNTAEKSWDNNVSDPAPVLRLPNGENQAAFDAAVARRSAAVHEYEERRSDAMKRFDEWLAAGNKPKAVSTDALDVNLLFNEGAGDKVTNYAPEAKTPAYAAITNPLVWGESLWFWPSMRMDINTQIPMPDQGDFEADQPFSVSMWVRTRLKPGNISSGNGALIAKMGNASENYQGWDVGISGDKLEFQIVHQWPDSAIHVDTPGIPRGEWIHLAVSYDGSRSASGLKIYVNGKPAPTSVLHDTLKPEDSIRNNFPLELGRRHDSDLLRENSYQDVRIYHRELTPEEFARLPFEDPAARLLEKSPDPEKWTPAEKFLGLNEFFLGSVDQDASKLRQDIQAAEQEMADLAKDGPATLIAKERPGPAHAWVLDRGVYTARKALVIPATPKFLPPPPHASNPSRLDLANWLLTDENPLFARVTVNRMWAELFGTGLVETTDDFGIMGARPSHPELLDWLAVEFRESGWDVNHMYRLLLTSATYQQSNRITPEKLEADPSDRLLSRGPRFRMDAEVLRDTALQASGLLVEKVGGPSVKPYQPEGIWEAVSMPESDTLHYKQDSGEALYRRSMYTFWKRFAPPPSMETFDAPAREVVCTRRARTNTPLQALVTMNDPQFVEAARKLAERVIHQASSTDERLDFLSEILLSRALDDGEKSTLTKSLTAFSGHFRENPDDAKELLTTGEAPSDTTLDPTEVATWTMVANQFFNFDETLNK